MFTIAPPPGLEQGRDLVLHAVEHARQIDVDDLGPGIERTVGRWGRQAGDASVVAGHVQPPKSGHRALDQAARVLGLSHIGRLKKRLTAGRFNQGHRLRAAIQRQVRHQYPRTLTRKGQCSRPPYARGRTGDQGHFVLEHH
jgi:hypothetical protein